MHAKQAGPTIAPSQASGFRRYLYLTAALTGGVVLIIEILGAKMLAPYFGTSHFVWTAQIAVTLISLAAGYYLGGWLGDRSPRVGRLYGCIVAAALYLCLAVRLCEPMAYACLRFNLAIGALMASALLFFVPLTLLAMVAPFAVRVLTGSLNTVGRQVGRLSAISTIGSVGGTVLIGYVLIPFLPNSTTMYLTAALLMWVGAGYFLIWGKGGVRPPVTAVGLGIGLVLVYSGINQARRAYQENIEELYRGNSNFGLMQVVQSKDGQQRLYLNDFLTQNTYDPATQQSRSLFTYMLHGLARAYTARLEAALCIGLGVGIVPMELARQGIRVDVVEINPAVVPLATRYFGLQPERLNLVIGDGRYYLNRCAKKYDTIILDAFLGDSSPSHLLTREAFQAMQKALNPGGTLVMNSFGDFEPGSDFFCASLAKTLRSVFATVIIHDGGTGNIFFAASDQPELRLLGPADLTQVHPSCRSSVQLALATIRQTDPEHGWVLRDDYNPVEFFDAPNREQLRRLLALSRESL